MCAHGAYPGRAAIAVVAGVVDVLHVERRVVAFLDVLAAVVQAAIAQQKSETAVVQIVLVVTFDGVGDKGEADLVIGAMPLAAGVVSAASTVWSTSV